MKSLRAMPFSARSVPGTLPDVLSAEHAEHVAARRRAVLALAAHNTDTRMNAGRKVAGHAAGAGLDRSQSQDEMLHLQQLLHSAVHGAAAAESTAGTDTIASLRATAAKAAAAAEGVNYSTAQAFMAAFESSVQHARPLERMSPRDAPTLLPLFKALNEAVDTQERAQLMRHTARGRLTGVADPAATVAAAASLSRADVPSAARLARRVARTERARPWRAAAPAPAPRTRQQATSSAQGTTAGSSPIRAAALASQPSLRPVPRLHLDIQHSAVHAPAPSPSPKLSPAIANLERILGSRGEHDLLDDLLAQDACDVSVTATVMHPALASHSALRTHQLLSASVSSAALPSSPAASASHAAQPARPTSPADEADAPSMSQLGRVQVTSDALPQASPIESMRSRSDVALRYSDVAGAALESGAAGRALLAVSSQRSLHGAPGASAVTPSPSPSSPASQPGAHGSASAVRLDAADEMTRLLNKLQAGDAALSGQFSEAVVSKSVHSGTRAPFNYQAYLRSTKGLAAYDAQYLAEQYASGDADRAAAAARDMLAGHVPWLEECDADAQEQVLRAARVVELPHGRTLFAQGSTDDTVYIVLAGLVDVAMAATDAAATLELAEKSHRNQKFTRAAKSRASSLLSHQVSGSSDDEHGRDDASGASVTSVPRSRSAASAVPAAQAEPAAPESDSEVEQTVVNTVCAVNTLGQVAAGMDKPRRTAAAVGAAPMTMLLAIPGAVYRKARAVAAAQLLDDAVDALKRTRAFMAYPLRDMRVCLGAPEAYCEYSARQLRAWWEAGLDYPAGHQPASHARQPAGDDPVAGVHNGLSSILSSAGGLSDLQTALSGRCDARSASGATSNSSTGSSGSPSSGAGSARSCDTPSQLSTQQDGPACSPWWSLSQWEGVWQMLSRQRYNAGEVICQQGKNANSWYSIRRGFVRVVRSVCVPSALARGVLGLAELSGYQLYSVLLACPGVAGLPDEPFPAAAATSSNSGARQPAAPPGPPKPLAQRLLAQVLGSPAALPEQQPEPEQGYLDPASMAPSASATSFAGATLTAQSADPGASSYASLPARGNLRVDAQAAPDVPAQPVGTPARGRPLTAPPTVTLPISLFSLQQHDIAMWVDVLRSTTGQEVPAAVHRAVQTGTRTQRAARRLQLIRKVAIGMGAKWVSASTTAPSSPPRAPPATDAGARSSTRARRDSAGSVSSVSSVASRAKTAALHARARAPKADPAARYEFSLVADTATEVLRFSRAALVALANAQPARLAQEFQKALDARPTDTRIINYTTRQYNWELYKLRTAVRLSTHSQVYVGRGTDAGNREAKRKQQLVSGARRQAEAPRERKQSASIFSAMTSTTIDAASSMKEGMQTVARAGRRGSAASSSGSPPQVSLATPRIVGGTATQARGSVDSLAQQTGMSKVSTDVFVQAAMQALAASQSAGASSQPGLPGAQPGSTGSLDDPGTLAVANFYRLFQHNSFRTGKYILQDSPHLLPLPTPAFLPKHVRVQPGQVAVSEGSSSSGFSDSEQSTRGAPASPAQASPSPAPQALQGTTATKKFSLMAGSHAMTATEARELRLAEQRVAMGLSKPPHRGHADSEFVTAYDAVSSMNDLARAEAKKDQAKQREEEARLARLQERRLHGAAGAERYQQLLAEEARRSRAICKPRVSRGVHARRLRAPALFMPARRAPAAHLLIPALAAGALAANSAQQKHIVSLLSDTPTCAQDGRPLTPHTATTLALAQKSAELTQLTGAGALSERLLRTAAHATSQHAVVSVATLEPVPPARAARSQGAPPRRRSPKLTAALAGIQRSASNAVMDMRQVDRDDLHIPGTMQRMMLHAATQAAAVDVRAEQIAQREAVASGMARVPPSHRIVRNSRPTASQQQARLITKPLDPSAVSASLAGRERAGSSGPAHLAKPKVWNATSTAVSLGEAAEAGELPRTMEGSRRRHAAPKPSAPRSVAFGSARRGDQWIELLSARSKSYQSSAARLAPDAQEVWWDSKQQALMMRLPKQSQAVQPGRSRRRGRARSNSTAAHGGSPLQARAASRPAAGDTSETSGVEDDSRVVRAPGPSDGLVVRGDDEPAAQSSKSIAALCYYRSDRARPGATYGPPEELLRATMLDLETPGRGAGAKGARGHVLRGAGMSVASTGNGDMCSVAGTSVARTLDSYAGGDSVGSGAYARRGWRGQ